jgi:hypothetical protein
MSYPILLINQQIIENQNLVNYKDVANEFCNLYYTTIIIKGISGVLHLFDQNAICHYNGIESTGMYSVMTQLATENIHRFIYSGLNYTPTLINTDILMIQVSGNCQALTFSNQITNIYKFTETFILKFNEKHIIVVNYLFRLIF